jgi:hypothetical protein
VDYAEGLLAQDCQQKRQQSFSEGVVGEFSLSLQNQAFFGGNELKTV